MKAWKPFVWKAPPLIPETKPETTEETEPEEENKPYIDPDN